MFDLYLRVDGGRVAADHDGGICNLSADEIASTVSASPAVSGNLSLSPVSETVTKELVSSLVALIPGKI